MNRNGLVWRAIAFELGMWRSLIRWIARRPVGPEGAEPFSYAGAVTPVILGFIIVSAIEIPVVHLLLPWPTARIVLLIAGIQGLIWMIGLLASIRVHPHLVTEAGLRLRHGSRIDFVVPWEDIAAVSNRIRSLNSSSRTLQFEDDAAGRILNVGVSGQTNIDITLREPITVKLPQGTSEPIVELRCYVDEPKPFLARAAELRLARVDH